MYKNILVPVLFDDAHKPTQSLETARVLADDGAKITLLHVIEDIPSYATNYLPENHMEKAVDDAEAALEKMAEGIPGGVSKVIRGHAARTLLDYAEKDAVDCIVVRSHKPGLPDYLLGGTAARIVRHAQCAVHVIR